jgi:hypothetical protein
MTVSSSCGYTRHQFELHYRVCGHSNQEFADGEVGQQLQNSPQDVVNPPHWGWQENYLTG